MNQNITLQLSETVSLELIFVQGTGNDTFRMGGTDEDNPYCNVAVDDFWIGKYPVTQAQWEAVMGDSHPNPSFFKGKNRPVERVSWNDAIAFINALNEKLKGEPILKVKAFALPTEAQWEYAARGGVHWRDAFIYAGSDDINKVAWYYKNSHSETQPVGLKHPNQLGIYDMSGNVWEWCLSDYSPYPYREDYEENNMWDRGYFNLFRGGSWGSDSNNCAAAKRGNDLSTAFDDDYGFRLCLLQFNY